MHSYAWNDSEARAMLTSLRIFAEEPAHRYRPGGDAPIPGYDERFVRRIPFTEEIRGQNKLRIVFTITEDRDGQRWRHASVSARKGEPPAILVDEILGYLGFHGRLLAGDMLVKRGEPDTPNEGAFIIRQALEPTP